MFLLLLMLRGELADQLLAPTLPFETLQCPQTATAGLDIDGHQPIGSLGPPASLGIHQISAERPRPCHPGDGGHQLFEQLFGTGNQTTGQERCLGIESLTCSVRRLTDRPHGMADAELGVPERAKQVRRRSCGISDVVEEHQVDVGVEAELTPAIPAEGDHRHRCSSRGNQGRHRPVEARRQRRTHFTTSITDAITSQRVTEVDEVVEEASPRIRWRRHLSHWYGCVPRLRSARRRSCRRRSPRCAQPTRSPLPPAPPTRR